MGNSIGSLNSGQSKNQQTSVGSKQEQPTTQSTNKDEQVKNNVAILLSKNEPKNDTKSDTSDIFKGITELDETIKVDQKGGKRSMPLINDFRNNLAETSDNISYGLENNGGRKRYTKYDLFKILRDLDVDTEGPQQGGGEDNNKETENSSNDDNESMAHIKNIILKELETLKNSKSSQLGGSGCGCNDSGDKKKSHKLSSKLNLKNIIVDDMVHEQLGGTVVIDATSSSTTSKDSDSSSSTELGKSNKSFKKIKSVKKNESTDSDSDSKFFIQTSESGDGREQTSNSESDKSNRKNTKSDSEEGLSMFPFNSSDVNSSRSIKNYRMLRRKI